MKLKKYLIVVVAIAAYCSSLPAQNAMQFQLHFNEEDYSIRTDNGLSVVESHNSSDILMADMPALPMRQVNVVIPSTSECSQVSLLNSTPALYRDGFTLATTPQDIPTSLAGLNAYENRQMVISDVANPAQWITLGATKYKDVSILHYAISPFDYDAATQLLRFSSEITLEISLTASAPDPGLSPISEVTATLWKDLVVNPSMLEEEDITLSNISNIGDTASPNSMGIHTGNINPQQVDYLIITHSSLYSAFSKLIDWKSKKGLRCKMISVEDIAKLYDNLPTQEQIKMYIRDQLTNGLTYVLLGGDPSLVPVPRCYVKNGNYVQTHMPTDLYYACFDGNFKWNANGNSTIGEVDDNCNLTPNVIVSRLLVTTNNEATSAVKKILQYEQGGSNLGYNMLMMGKSLYSYYSDGTSDSYNYAKQIYEDNIQPYWEGNVDFQFDTIDTVKIHDGSINILLRQPTYAFVSMFSHGTTWAWSTPAEEYFWSSVAYDFPRENSPGTIITTIACDVNAFDRKYISEHDVWLGKDCLSRDFTVAPKSGVVAFFGSSREGFVSSSKNYEAQFYKSLFTINPYERTFGKVATQAKMAYVANSSTNCGYRWLQFSLNPIGDPEMPIFLETPKKFTNVKMYPTESGVEGQWTIDVGENGVWFALKGIKDGKDYLIREYVGGSTKFNLPPLPEKPVLCLMKPGFVPDVYSNFTTTQELQKMIEGSLIAEETMTCSYDNGGKVLNVEVADMTGSNNLQVIVTDMMGSQRFVYDVENEEQTIDLSHLSAGIYGVTSVINGQPQSSKRICVR